MGYRIDYSRWSTAFSVPCEVADRHIRLCGAASLRVLMVVLRRCGEELSLSQIADAVGLSEEDAKDALHYWLEAGILQESGKAIAPKAPDAEPSAADPPSSASALSASSPQPVPHLPVRVPPAKLPPAEIQKLVHSKPELGFLLQESEAVLGKTLSSADLSTLVSLYDWAGLPADIILMAVTYCAERGKPNLRYIEKTALSWVEKGIDTHEAIERYIKEQDQTEDELRQVKTAFGIYDRKLTAKETEFIRTWFHRYGFDISVIKLAYETAIDNTGKLNFPYINKVLSNWHEKGITSCRQASEERLHRPEAEGTAQSFDLDQFEQHLQSRSL
ncbi:MAG: DnaD domain protein [Oscillospiraceae bacterium]|nr:DnaD domain protein [Oscillospiraceae bacterium]